MIVDAHAHIYDILAGYGAKGEFRPLGQGRGIWSTGEVEQFFPAQYGDLGFSAESLLALMDEAGVDHAVLLQGGNYGFHNDYAAEAARRWPDRFTAAATLDPCAFYAEKILDHMIGDEGIRVLKFELSQFWGLTGYHPGLSLDGVEFAPVFRRAEEAGVTVTLDLGPMGTAGCDPEALVRVRERYPALTMVLAHCFFPKEDGKNGLRLEYMKRLVGDRFFFDIANLGAMGITPGEVLDFLRAARAAVGADHLMWGTDVPGVLKRSSYRQMMATVTESGIFREEEVALVMGETARRVYQIKV